MDENKQDAPIPGVICNFIAISLSVSVNKHKPWIETTYHGIITENDDKVLLDPPLIALDKDAPLRYAGEGGCIVHNQASRPSELFHSTFSSYLHKLMLLIDTYMLVINFQPRSSH